MRRWLAVTAVVVGSACGGCSLLIGSEPSPLACSQEGQIGPPACDPGFVCTAGLCRQATAPNSEPTAGADGGRDAGGDAAVGGASGASEVGGGAPR